MARNYFKFGSYANTDYGIILSSPIVFPSPSQRGEAVHIPGKDGTTWKPDGAYDDVAAVATLWIPPAYMAQLSNIRAWLTGSGNLEVATNAASYYKARVNTPFTPVARDFGNGYDATVMFTASPFPYVKTPADVTVTTSPTTMPNAYPVFSLPLLEITGTGDVEIIFGATVFELTGLTVPVFLDCETHECYTAAAMANDIMVGAFPTLLPGDNVISWTGTIASIKISPRWRTL